MATTTEHTPDDARLTQEIARLAEAIRDLAHRPERPDSDEDPEQRRLIQRVDFSYRALGTLMGRVSRRFDDEFDVPVFDASWDLQLAEIELTDLPAEARWIELRTPRKVEVVRVRRAHDEHDDQADADAYHGGERSARIRPIKFNPDDAVDSVLGLRHPRGPVVALGPRVAPRPSSTD
jgi:hypothetical protein